MAFSKPIRILSSNEYLFEELFITFQESYTFNHSINSTLGDVNFGIIDLQLLHVPPNTTKEYEFVFNIDNSGSMSDLCKDKRSKMQHIIHTLKNMVMYFIEHPDIKANVTIIGFDNKIYNILDRTSINKETVESVITSIESMRPRGSTDIELALTTSLKCIEDLQNQFPENDINHIFMTDGDITNGETNTDKLIQFVNRNIHNSFIGFGIHHNEQLLNELSNDIKSSYYFIDKLENAGIVYGEILHNIINKVLTDSIITVDNGLIYNFKTNEWENTLEIGNINSDDHKIYHIISQNPETCNVIIRFNDCDGEITCRTIDYKINKMVDLSKYVFRQRTMQIIYETKNINNKINNDYCHFSFNLTNKNQKENKELKDNMQNKLKEFMEEIKSYMKENHLENDIFFKTLCDDIYVCYTTLGTKYGNMYSTARQTSQGSQRQYTVSDLPDDINNKYENCITLKLPKLSKNNIFFNQDHEDDYDKDNNEINDFIPISSNLDYELSNFEHSPYVNPVAQKLMREISSGVPTLNQEENNNL